MTGCKRNGRTFRDRSLAIAGTAETARDLPAAPSLPRRRGTLPGHRPPSGKYVFGRDGDARIDQHALERRQLERRGEHLADAAHQRACADRGRPAHRRRSRAPPRRARIVACETVGPREKPQRRRRIGRSAAEPGRDRQLFFEANAPKMRPAARSASARAALSTRLSAAAPACAALGPRTVKRKFAARRKAQGGRRRRRTPPGFRSRDSRRRGGRARAASD